MFTNEKEGQIQFYDDFLKRINNELDIEDVLEYNTDGILNGNIIEFKLYINNLSSALFQSIKYLSHMRIKGKSIPKNIVLISLNDATAYVYKSEDYLSFIEQVYSSSASKETVGLVANEPNHIFKYYENDLDNENLIKVLKENKFTKIHIDENCIVGWAERFYKENPEANKSDFIGDKTGKVKIIGEIRNPDKFKDFIYPYPDEDNIKFQYLMDKLNDSLHKKKLGAFYTPKQYAEKSLELVREAIKQIPEGNDYIILDRCAGTGNLEKLMTDGELSHCVLSTIEYYEYKVLLEVLGDKVRHIIPPTEKEDTFNMGLVRGADALSKEYIENEVINQYVNDPNCNVILFENPPYAETTSIEFQKKSKGKKNSEWKNSFVVAEMKKDLAKFSGRGIISNDLANVFIWSGFNYYLKKPNDCYIVYSPIKYWKSQHLTNKRFVKGFGFNRKHFHTNTNAFISCIFWSNEPANLAKIPIECYDIIDNELVHEKTIEVERVYSLFSSKYYDKRTFSNDSFDGIYCELNGKESHKSKFRLKSKRNKNIIGYLVSQSNNFDNPRLGCLIVRSTLYNGNGFYLRDDNFLSKLPLFSAGKFTDNFNSWIIMNQLMKSGDKEVQYTEDVNSGKLKDWLLRNLLWISLTHYSHMRSFLGSDGVLYKNDLCLGNTLGETIAAKELKDLQKTEEELNLIELFNLILEDAKQTKEYNDSFNYGLYQIDEELNTKYKNEDGKTIYNYPKLNGNILTLKKLLKDYYLESVAPKLFEYAFLK